MFTSIGKKVMTTTTAAFDGQSKPNHMTMIGAMPMIGSAETRLPIGSRPRFRNGDAVDEDGDDEAGAAADGVAGEHRLQEGLAEVGPERSAATATSRAQIALGGGRRTKGTPKPRTSDLPEEEQPDAEEERHDDAQETGADGRDARHRRQPVDEQPGEQPGGDDQGPEARRGDRRRTPAPRRSRSPATIGSAASA